MPQELMDAFKASEEVGAIAVLMIDDGFDAERMRVLAAWKTLELGWKRPRKPPPDQGRPTAAAWAWIRSGYVLDYEAFAAAAAVTVSTARAHVDVILAARLAYPDGTLSKGAQAAINEHVKQRLVGKKDSGRGGRRKPSPDEAN